MTDVAVLAVIPAMREAFAAVAGAEVKSCACW